jgi:hypothetical protein
MRALWAHTAVPCVFRFAIGGVRFRSDLSNRTSGLLDGFHRLPAFTDAS